jgi:uncharacterized protein (TIGR02246 family)
MTMPFDPVVNHRATSATVNADRAEIQAVRDAFVNADNAGDAEAMAQLLADDIVVMHPYCGAFEGKDAVRTFMESVLGEVHAEFDKHVSYSTIELAVSGDLAYERGVLRQQLTPRAGGAIEHDEGMYLWIYTRRGEQWRIARITGIFKPAEESTDGQTEEGC